MFNFRQDTASEEKSMIAKNSMIYKIGIPHCPDMLVSLKGSGMLIGY